MTGGLIQLVTTGIQDAPIVGNPEITFFKTVYKQHTLFSLCQNDRFLGKIQFNKEYTKKIEDNGDLLYNQYFKIEIPFFDIIKEITTTQLVDNGYNINELETTYANLYCLFIYYNNNWYLIPDKLFQLSSFNNVLLDIDSHFLSPYILPEYIKPSNLGQYCYLYQIEDNSISSIINILRISSNFWEQFWIDIISKTTNINFLNKLLTIKSDYNNFFNLIKYRLFNLFWERNYYKKNIKYFDFSFSTNQTNSSENDIIYKTETERYFEYLNSFDYAINNMQDYDIDIAYKYIINNFLDFNEYKNNILPYNSLIISLMLSMLYGSSDLVFSFWKKYDILDDNEINTNIINTDTHFVDEWNQNIIMYAKKIFNTNNLKNHIFEKYKNEYSSAEEKINNIFSNLSFENPKELYIKSKIILSRFYEIPNTQLNFNDYFLATKYNTNIIDSYNYDNYVSLKKYETNKYKTLLNNYDSLDTNEMNNLTPVDIQNIYANIAIDVVNLAFTVSNLTNSLKSFFILWQNSVISRLYKRFLDTYRLVKNNGELFDLSNNRKLKFYYSIFPSNLYFFDEFKNSYYEMFYKNSFIGSLAIANNNFIKLKENIYNVEINDLLSTNYENIGNNNKNFNKLKIINTYYYIYYESNENKDNYDKYTLKKIIFDNLNKRLLIRYNNYYDINCSIELKIRGIITNYSNISFENINNERKTNSLYLVFSGLELLSDNTPINESEIILTVTYTNYLPIIAFYKQNMIYPQININKYYILNKYSTNNAQINNIIDNKVAIDNNIVNSDYIKILTIKSFNSEKIIAPAINTFSLEINSGAAIFSETYVTPGTHLYCISYFTTNGESDVSHNLGVHINDFINEYFTTELAIIIINNIPISSNPAVIGRKIYRTKSYDTKFYLLKVINDNTTTKFIDDVPDENLAIEYNIESNIRLNNLTSIPDSIIQIPIKLKPTGELYTIYDLNNNIIKLPNTYDNIKEIYIEELALPYQIINMDKFIINNSGEITLIDSNDFSKNYLYYLVNPDNFKDNVKLICSKPDIPFKNPPFIITRSIGTPNLTGKYRYMLTFYNIDTGLESLPSSSILYNQISSGYFLTLSKLSPIFDSKYNSWNIYRTKTINDANPDLPNIQYYYLTTVNGLIDNLFEDKISDDNLVIPMSTQIFYLSSPINTHVLNKPGILPELTNLLETGNVNIGTHKYVITYYDNITGYETMSSLSSEITLSFSSKILVKLPISKQSNITSRIIYRTESNSNKYKFLEKINDNITTEYIDNKNDSMLDYVLQTNNTINKPLYKPDLIISDIGNVNYGIHKYVITYYNSITDEESYVSPYNEIILSGNSKVTITLPISFDSRVTHRKIYRTEANGFIFKYLTSINNNIDTIYIDNIVDSLLGIPIKIDINIIPSNIKPNLEIIDNGNINIGTHYYAISYFNSLTGEESLASPQQQITLTNTSKVQITLPISNDSNVTSRKIYRTESNQHVFKLLTIINNNNESLFIDDINDYNLISANMLVGKQFPINNKIEYKILKIPYNDITPNLNSFISQSTDLNFINEKGLSDFNDYLFNKPFLMMVKNSTPEYVIKSIYTQANLDNNPNNDWSLPNNIFYLKNSFNTSNMYFYNIGFKIDKSSVITLNDLTVNYIIPISSQQFFIKEVSNKYYNINTNNGIISEANDYEILSTKFNPSFEEFNIIENIIKENFYSDSLIDKMADKIDNILKINKDYQTVIDTIDNTSSIYINIFKKILNPSNTNIYGKTSINILNSLNKLNKLDNILNDKMLLYDLSDYNNVDFLKYSHYALRLKSENKIVSDAEIMGLNSNIITINSISPVYENYNSNKKISNNLSQYLLDVSDFFSSHINYINNNIDYLNISNPNNYQEDFLSSNEIQQHKLNNFYDYSNINTIELLHPIIDDNIYKINLFNKITINNFDVDINNNKIKTLDFNDNIIENKYTNTTLKNYNRNEYSENKFNYLGLININSNGNFIFNDNYIFITDTTKYYKLDDNKICKATYNSNLNRLNIDSEIKDCLIINPIELTFNNISNQNYTLTRFTNDKYLYSVKVDFDLGISIIANNGLLTDTVILDNYIIYNSKLYIGKIEWTLVIDGKFYIISDNINYNKKYVKMEINGNITFLTFPQIIPITSNNGLLTDTVNINDYIINDSKLYIGISGYTNKFSLLVSGNYFITSDNTIYNKKCITIDSFGNISFLSNETFMEIIADSGSLYDPIIIDKYIIVNTKLYCGTLGQFGNPNYWAPVVSGYYLITSNISQYDNKFIYTENQEEILLGNIYILDLQNIIKITSNNGLLSDPVIIDNYIINNSKIYIGINSEFPNSWTIVKSGNYFITSNNSMYNKKYVNISNNGTITLLDIPQLTIINANAGLLTDDVINDTFIINNSKLYIGISNIWTLVTVGEYYLYSDITQYNDKQIKIDTFGNIILIDFPFNSIYTNFLINNIILSGYFKIDSNNLSSCYLYFLLDNEISFNSQNILFQDIPNNYNSWKVTPVVSKYSIELFKKINYYTNQNVIGDIFLFDSKYYTFEEITNLSINSILDGNYFNLQSEKLSLVINTFNKINTGIPNVNQVLYEYRPSFIIKNNIIYSYDNYSTILKETDNNNYILLYDYDNNYILKIKDIITLQIPQGNYHCWLYPHNELKLITYNIDINIDNVGNISDIYNIPTYSFYMIKNDINSCIYYYETGNNITINNNISYYNIKNVSLNKIYLIDNELFDTQMKQLIHIYITKQMSENLVTKELIKNNSSSNIDIDDINQLYYRSEYIKDQFNIKTINNFKMILDGTHEILVNMILKSDNIFIYHPLIIKKYNTINIPKILFKYNEITYTKSFIPIYIKTNPNVKLYNTTLLANCEIGIIDGTDTYSSLSEYLIVNPITKKIYIKTGFDITSLNYGLHLWRIQGFNTTTNQTYIIYTWTLFTDDINLFNKYINLYTDIDNKIGTSEPLFIQQNSELIIPNYGLNYDLIECSPNILTKFGNNFILKLDDTITRELSYKYYTDTRNIDTNRYKYSIKNIDYNYKLNIKPYIELAINDYTFMENINNILTNNNANIFILIWKSKSTGEKKIDIYLKSELSELYKFASSIQNNNSDISYLSTYFSINYPFFIKNNILVIPKSNDIYEIVNYNKLYLEQGEIIILDNNYFYVEGLNVFNNNYELKLIKGQNHLRYCYTGYFTIGNYLRKDNKYIPDILYQTTMTLYRTKTINIGDIYYNNRNSKLVISTTRQNLTYINTFSESSLKIKLLYNSGKLYLFDNFVKLKKLDLLLYNSTIYEIKNIRDNQIFLNNTFNIDTSYNNTFIEFILPYQPFNNEYINFDINGNILSHSIDDNETIILNMYTDYKLITANNDNILSSVIIGNYIIYNNKLFIGTIKGWEMIVNGFFHIISNNSIYNNKYVIINESIINIFIQIIANNGDIFSSPVIDNYIINNDKLYFGGISEWELITTGYYLITSNNINYNLQYIIPRNDGTINIMTNNLYTVKNNKINTDSSFSAGYRWIRLLKTKYKSHFENKFIVPKYISNYNFNNKFSIDIITLYDHTNKRFKLLNEINILDAFNFYYLQPVNIGGTFNQIKNVIQDTYIYIYLMNPLLISENMNDKEILITLTPRYYNDITLYSQLKFKYNFAIQPSDYNNLEDKNIEVIRYALKNDKLIFVQKIFNNQPIIFKYGRTITENQKLVGLDPNNEYTNIYCYNYKILNNDGTISNHDTLIGSYQILIEESSDYQKVHLAKIIYPNNLKIYTDISINHYNLSFSKIIGCMINKNNEFIYNNLKIYETRNLLEINDKKVEIIKKYDIRLIGTPEIIDNKFKQEIQFIGNIINEFIYDKIYLEENDNINYLLITTLSPKKYFIISNNYLSNNIKTIYTKNINWINSATKQNRTKKDKLLNDNTIESYIDTHIVNQELLTQNIIISRVTFDSLQYYYKLVDGSTNFSFNQNESYKIFRIYQNILDFNNNNRTIKLSEPIDNDSTEISQDEVIINFWTINEINTNNVFDYITLFNNVKQLKNNLLSKSIIEDIYILNYLKPWKYWSLLNSINKINSLSTFVNNIYLKWNTNVIKMYDDLIDINYSYLTNDEVTILSNFLISINKSNIIKNNFNIIKNQIEPLIFNNLYIWLSNPSFFLNVIDNINLFFKVNNLDVIFDGNNIIFNNDPNPDYINNDIASYITNEFTYDPVLNIVYRSLDSYNEINNQIGNWINKTINNKFFGISIHKLLRYLRIIGEELKELLEYFNKPLNNTPEYVYNNPIKFIINKLWEKYNNDPYLNKLEKDFNNKLILNLNYNKTTEIYSSVNYLASFVVEYTGVNSITYFYPLLYTKTIEYNIDNLSIYNPTIIKPIDKNIELITKPLYPYTINFQTNEININGTYNIDFLNGTQIAKDLVIENPNIYPDQLNFYSEYNIKSNDFLIIKQKNDYSIINSTLLGQLYNIIFDIVDIEYIDQIYYRNYNLIIIKKINNIIQLLIPLTILETNNLGIINTDDLFELRNNISIRKITIENNKQYIDFYNLKFNYIDNKTLLKTDNQLYLLQKDIFNNFYIEGLLLNTHDVIIVTLVKPQIINNLQEILYQYEINSDNLDKKYSSENNNLIMPLEFKLVDEYYNNTITPIKITTIENNKLIFHFTNNDNNLINDTKYKWSIIRQDKRLGQDIINKIESIVNEPIEEYLYFFDFILPMTVNTTIYLYDSSINDIDILNDNYEPTINKSNKTSINIYQENSQTYFTVNQLYTISKTNNDICFILKNTWNINNYNYLLNKLEINLPNDFILNTSYKYYYKINDNTIDKNTFIFNNGYLSFSWLFGNITGTIIFKQYYIEDNNGIVVIPELNRKYKITYDYSYQYKPTDNFYIIPYSGLGNEFNEHMYKLKTNITTTLNGFLGKYSETNIYLYFNGNKYNCKIFDEYHNGFIYYIISSNELLDVTLDYTYNLEDNISYNVDELSFYQHTIEFGKYYKQESINTIYIFMRDKVNNYIMDSDDINPKPNKFYLVSYLEYKINNIFSPDKFIQSNKMKKNINYSYTTSTIIEKPIWENYDKFFSYIQLYFNDQLMEELNENVYNIQHYLYNTEDQRKQLFNMTKIRQVDNSKWEFYLPLSFWFSNKPGHSLPIVALPYTEIRLVYKLNEINYLLKNILDQNFKLSINPEIRINLITEFILLDSIERKLFGSYSHEYIVDRYRTYPNYYINKGNEVIDIKLSGLIKDIHFISSPINHPKLHYYPEIINKYDFRYNRYIKSNIYYNEFIKNNIYTSEDQKDYAIDIEIIKNNNIEYENYIKSNDKTNFVRINKLITNFSGFSIWNHDLLKFLMYYENKFISTLPENRKIYVMTMYLKYQYKNISQINELSPINSVILSANGTDLFSERDYNYFTNVIPYNKFKNTLPTGYYTYTFSLYPTDDQHSGHLNFTNFDTSTIEIKSNEQVITEPYKLDFIIKEYNILRIMSGMGSMGWL